MNVHVTGARSRVVRGVLAIGMFLVAASTTGCLVTKARYDELLTDRDAVAAQAAQEQELRERAEMHRDEAELAREQTEVEVAVREDRLDAAEVSIRDALLQIAEYQRLLEAQRLQLDSTQMVLGERSNERSELMARIEELSALETELRERDQMLQNLRSRFDALIDAGTLSVELVRGRMVINMAQDVLFEPGSADLGDLGVTTLLEMAGVLATMGDRELQVEGHSDNVPIATRMFPSNWELSSARAMAVVHVLVEGGVDATTLSGAGFAEFRPVSTNDTPTGRALNRRIEIVILPNLDALLDPGN